MTPLFFPSPVKIVNTDQCRLKQGLPGLKSIMKDLFKEEIVIPTASLFNSPIWPILKLGKNKWHLIVQYLNLNALVLH